MPTTDDVRVDPTNAEQLKAWDGDEGSFWAAHADHVERALDAYRARFFAAAAIADGERVLDIGCGTGRATRDAARATPAGSALGVDLSSAMLDVARRRAAAEGLTNVAFEHADAQIHPFEHQRFDIAIGQCSAMFFGDRVTALANIGQALRPGGRLVLLTWQPFTANEWIREILTALAAGRDVPAPPHDAPGPFSLADPDEVRSVLTAAGYRDLHLAGATAPMWFGRDAHHAHGFLAGLMGWMLHGLEPTDRTLALDALRANLVAHETPDGVTYPSATWIIRATRP